ncbi:hypothetical protein Pint_18040 [Pistacia integerrima]|uniref:Uncharacterized protein n=1 Tax=Pistacia integerrima TaxID=434235 RepID=A0ACC0YT49_9ROSI|nr:hypothetical protein Pint_18040 [Pistacia integerrima]
MTSSIFIPILLRRPLRRDYNSFRGRGCEYNYYIFNSTTKQYTTLPPLRVKTGVSRSIFGANLAFDPLKSPHHKVICVRNCDSLRHGHYQIEIYSPETGHWRLSGGTFTGPTDTNFNHGVFWKGSIHWISPPVTCFYFNVDEEKLRDMPMPPIPEEWDERRRSYFGESGGYLHLIENYGPGGAVFNVLEMERGYSGWFVKYRVDLFGVATVFPEMIRNHNDPEPGPEELNDYAFSVLCVAREENDEDSYLVVQIPKKVIRYNFKDQTFKKIHDFAPSEFDAHEPELERFDVFQHIESLACV